MAVNNSSLNPSTSTTYPAASSNDPCPQMIAAGKCTVSITIDGFTYACICQKGEFPVGSLESDAMCTACPHPIKDHKRAVPDTSRQQAGINTESEPQRWIGSIGSPVLDTSRQQVVVNGPQITPRQDTVTKLIDLIDKFRVIHVRGTPASGKSVLAGLLRDRLQAQGRLVSFYTAWVRDIRSIRPNRPWAALDVLFKEGCSGIWKPRGLSDVIIVDNAQETYGDEDFWNQIIKDTIDGVYTPRIRICLFCSFGCPSTGTGENVRYSPVFIPGQHRVTFTPQPIKFTPLSDIEVGLFYTRPEFDDVLSRAVRMEFPGLVGNMDDQANEYLFSVTNGHPGCVFAMVKFICREYRHNMQPETTFEITKQHIIDILDGNEDSVFEFMQGCDVAHSVPGKKDLTEPVRSILYDIAEQGNITWEWDPRSEALEKCYMNGWIHRMYVGSDIAEVAILPSRLHEKWIRHIIAQDVKEWPPRFTDLIQLCMEVLPKFLKTNLKNSAANKHLLTAAQLKPVEAQYQNEFYRAFNELVGRGVPISTKWAMSSDRVDFFLPQKKWAVELVGGHEQVDDHISRFKEGGQYSQWLKDKAVTDWIVINCTTTVPRAAHEESRLLHAIFSDNYQQLQIYDHNLNKLGPVYHLGN